jgi:hypothetical protein
LTAEVALTTLDLAIARPMSSGMFAREAPLASQSAKPAEACVEWEFKGVAMLNQWARLPIRRSQSVAFAGGFSSRLVVLLVLLIFSWSYGMAQQKGQYQPGQYGLNAGVEPDPGLSYASLNLNYSADKLNDANGNPIAQNAQFNAWALENIFFYVPKVKVLKAKIVFMVTVPTFGNGSLTDAQFGVTADWGLADMWVQPVTLAWHVPRADVWAGYAFMAPIGRYTPGDSNNIGSGYWGNNLTGAGTFYITKNMGTAANYMANWETHGQRTDRDNIHVTPGSAFTDEWGFSQVLPLNKQQTKLVQAGLIGYDQVQTSANTGDPAVDDFERHVPFYSVHAVGLQANYIALAKNWSTYFKWEHEYSAHAHPQGRTIVFGGVYTFAFPKSKAGAKP